MASEKSVEYMVQLAAERTPSVSAVQIRAWGMSVPQQMVSQKIDWLKQQPVYEPEDGIYVVSEMYIVKVQHAVHGSGKQYAKQLDSETGNFYYVPGLINRIRLEGRRMTLEDAKEFGDLYGMCCVCGRTLTNEESIEASIGPVCSGRLAA